MKRKQYLMSLNLLLQAQVLLINEQDVSKMRQFGIKLVLLTLCISRPYRK